MTAAGSRRALPGAPSIPSIIRSRTRMRDRRAAAERLDASRPTRKKSSGSVAEWSIALVLKTSKGQPFVSSNLTASANKNKNLAHFCGVQSK